MNGEADNSHFVSMHVYMHLVFKELNSVIKHIECCVTCSNRYHVRSFFGIANIVCFMVTAFILSALIKHTHTYVS